MNMNALVQHGTQRKLGVLVGVDFATTATKVVQLKQSKGELTLTGIDLLPSVDFRTTASRMELPRNLSSYYGCLAYSGTESVVRMVHAQLPAEDTTVPEPELRKLLNVTDEFRVSARLVNRGKGRQDSSLLAAAIPKDDVRYILNLFPAGPPAPASLEVSGLAFVSAFLNARGSECADEAVCLIDAGESVSHYVFMNKGEVVLVGKMDFGVRTLRDKLVADLGVDDELAASILDDRSINISTSLAKVMAPIIKQLSISRDFIERRMGCRVSKVYVSGGMSLLPSWSDELMDMIHTEVESWSPLENITIAPDVVSVEMKQQATRFAAAIGTAIGGFQDS